MTDPAIPALDPLSYALLVLAVLVCSLVWAFGAEDRAHRLGMMIVFKLYSVFARVADPRLRLIVDLSLFYFTLVTAVCALHDGWRARRSIRRRFRRLPLVLAVRTLRLRQRVRVLAIELCHPPSATHSAAENRGGTVNGDRKQ